MTACIERNLLRGNNFKIQIPLAPQLAEFVQDITFPGINMGNPEQYTPLHDIPHIGDKIKFDTIDMTFLIQENMANYRELYTWFLRVADPAAFPINGNGSFRTNEREKLYCDISFFLLNNNGDITRTVYIKDAFPIVVSPLNFSVMSEDVMVGNVTFVFSYLQFDTHAQDLTQE